MYYFLSLNKMKANVLLISCDDKSFDGKDGKKIAYFSCSGLVGRNHIIFSTTKDLKEHEGRKLDLQFELVLVDKNTYKLKATIAEEE